MRGFCLVMIFALTVFSTGRTSAASFLASIGMRPGGGGFTPIRMSTMCFPTPYNPGSRFPGIQNPVRFPTPYNPGTSFPGIHNPGSRFPGIHNPGTNFPGIHNPGCGPIVRYPKPVAKSNGRSPGYGNPVMFRSGWSGYGSGMGHGFGMGSYSSRFQSRSNHGTYSSSGGMGGRNGMGSSGY